MGSPAQASFPAWRQWLLAGVETEVGGRVRIIGEETGTRERLRAHSDQYSLFFNSINVRLKKLEKKGTYVVFISESIYFSLIA